MMVSKMKCPECNSKNIEKYDNGGTEYMCADCGCQWQLNNEGIIIRL